MMYSLQWKSHKGCLYDCLEYQHWGWISQWHGLTYSIAFIASMKRHSVWRPLHLWIIFNHCYAFAFRRRRHYVFGSSFCPSVSPSVLSLKYPLPVHGSIGPSEQPWLFFGLSLHPSVPYVRPDRFTGMSQRMHWGNGLKFCMLMYPDHLQNWLSSFWCHFFFKWVKFGVSGHFPENTWREWPEILHADVLVCPLIRELA